MPAVATPTLAPTATSTPTLLPTATVAPAHALAWQPHRPATDATPFATDNPSVTFSQADPMLAYECAAPDDGSDAPASVWVTHDGARTWQRAESVATGDAIGSCAVEADEVDPEIAVLWTVPHGYEQSRPLGTFHTFATLDGGATWTPLTTGPYPNVLRLVTYHDLTYALFFPPPPGSGVVNPSALAVSSDHLRTWTRVDEGFPSQVYDFWLNPVSGALLGKAGPTQPGIAADPFATSTDGGQAWTPLPGTPALGNYDVYVVQDPAVGQPWTVCRVGGTPTPSVMVTCTTDGGLTWVTRSVPQFYPLVVGIANDGSLLEAAANSPSGLPCRVYRLVPGATTWESLGQLPVEGEPQCLGITYVAGSGRGALWYLPLANLGAVDVPDPTPGQRLIYSAAYV
jgi:hypothetical protein